MKLFNWKLILQRFVAQMKDLYFAKYSIKLYFQNYAPILASFS